jgi:two-component system sensor histidine kinase/response regulator
LLSLINDILDFSKIEAQRLELEEIDFDLRNTLEIAVEVLAIKAHEKGLEVACHIRPEVPTALIGDPEKLRRVILNLAGNAIKFTSEGEVVITVKVEAEEAGSVRLHFTVSDSGIGIPPDKLETIFESFNQADSATSRKYGGTGLGLAISKRIVELMKGDIWVESAPGKGSTFHFIAPFPLSSMEAGQSLRAEELNLQGIRILIVDDNAANRLVFRDMVSSWGLLPTEAAGGDEALAEIKKAYESGHPYKLMLLDRQMPKTDGFEVARRIKKGPFGTDVEIVLLTSAGQKGDALRCKEVGISGYLPKPVKQADLLDGLRIALGRPSEKKGPVITQYAIQDARKRLNILLAEDNPINQQLAVMLLKKRGHRVVVASTGKEALDLWTKERFDLILMDVQMPEMDGLEATRLIREQEIRNRKRGRAIPIVAMTGHAMKQDRKKCLAVGMVDYISKPISAERLFSIIDKVVPSDEITSKVPLSSEKEGR